MQTTSTDYKLEIKKPSRSFECKISIGNNIYTNDDIVDIILETIQPGEGFSIGNTPSQTLDLTLLNRGDTIYSTSQVKVEIGLKIGATIEYILMGYFNIDDIEKTDYTTKITAYDNMIKFETPYFSSLTYPANLQQVVNELAIKTGVQFTGSLPAYTVKKLEGFTCREILGYVSSLCGGNALITREGKFTIVYSKELTYSITADNYIDYKREEVKYKIGKVSCKVGDKELNKGSLGIDSMEVKFENPWVNDSILNGIYTKLNGFEYLGYTMKWQGDISLDVGDTITCTDIKGAVRKIPILSQKFTYNGGLTAEIGAKGETKNKNSFNSSGSGSNKLDRVVTDLLIVNEALINKANIQDLEAVSIRTQKLEVKTAAIEIAIIDVAHVSDLTAINANIEKLIAADATMGQAIIGKANIADLTAINGKINILESSVGDIETLVNGNLTSNNIQSLILSSDKVTVINGFIKNAMIENLDVSKILAGDISTNKFRIKSDNGGIEIVGATQQFKDKNNRVRIQMGQDALGNFNFILRGEDGTTTLIDHTGIKEKAIANDLIKGNMISENAVGGKQIDYNSFTEEFNADTNTHTLKSSKVLLDKNNQTLDIAFNTLTTKVDEIEVGGRNLFKDSNYASKIVGTNIPLTSWGGNIAIASYDTDVPIGLTGLSKKIVCTTGGTGGGSYSDEDSFEIVQEETYTISFWAKDTGSLQVNGYIASLNRKSDNYYITLGSGFKLSTEWKRYSYTFKANTSGTFVRRSIIYIADTVWLSHFKLEKDNKATDWTPAPEDTDKAINNVKEITTSNTTAINIQQGKISTLISNTTIEKDGQTIQLKDSYNSTVATVDSINNVISSHTTTIDALTGQVTEVETKTNEVKRDLDGTVATVSKHTASINGLNSTVNTQSSSISQLQNSIKLKVEETQVNSIVNGAIDGIEVGGRNLLLNSGEKVTSSVYNIKNYTISETITNGTQVTLSIKGSLGAGKTHWGIYNSGGYISITTILPTDRNAQGVYVKTFNWVVGTSANTTLYVYQMSSSIVAESTIDWIKLEKGNKTTDWTSAPEDTQEQITSVSKRTATIETNLTGITSRVSTVEQTTTTIDGKVKDMDTRLKAAEVKITDSAIISTVSNTFISKEDATKTYATKSSLTQTEDSIVAKFTSTGGYNLLRNSAFANKNIANWGTSNITIYRNNDDYFMPERGWIALFISGATRGLFYQYLEKLTKGKRYTLSIKSWWEAKISSVRVIIDYKNGSTYIGNTVFDLENDGSQRKAYTFTVPNLNFDTCVFHFEVNNPTGASGNTVAAIQKPCLCEGDVAVWSPHPSELIDGSTQIDANGVTIYNGAIDIRNNTGASVLKGDSNGNLMVRGNLYADPANPILHLFEGCSLDATYHNEQGVGSAIRLKWNNENYVYVSTNDVSIYQGGIQKYGFTPNILYMPNTLYFNRQCKIDCSSGVIRLYTSTTVDSGIKIDADGTVKFLANGVSKHVFYTNGTKSGGTIEVDGTTLGMSPIDSPKVLLEDVLFDIDIQEEGTTVVLDSTFLKTISTYAVFCSNPDVTIVSKDRTSFYVRGYTGKVDFRVIGYRIGYEEQYYQVVG